MRALLIGVAAWGIASTALAAPPPCPDLPGVEAIWARPTTRYVFFGEIHGTAEIPQLFGDAVCHASRNRSVTVALELPSKGQDAFDVFIKSDGSPSAVAALLASPAWPHTRDGRSSRAVLGLIERVRTLRASGARLRLVGFEPQRPAGFGQHYRALGMASALAVAAYVDPGALVLVLTGNTHSDREPPSHQRPFATAASLLPPSETLSVINRATGGSTWSYSDGVGRVNSLPGSDPAPRGVTLGGALKDGHDGSYSPGRPYTASPPVGR